MYVTHSDKMVLVEGRRWGCGHQLLMFTDKTVYIAGTIDLVHTEEDPLHPFQVGWGRVGENSGGREGGEGGRKGGRKGGREGGREGRREGGEGGEGREKEEERECGEREG